MDDRFSANARAFAGLIAFLAWAGLVIQFGASTAAFGSLGSAAWHLSLFFTILTNTALAATFTGLALGKPAFGGPRLLGGIMLSILLVGVVYSLLLAGAQPLTGGDKYANMVMHYATPILAPLFWLVCAPKGFLRTRDPLIWAAYPLAYLAYALVRGGIDGHYPYYFLDVDKTGWMAVIGNATAIAAGFLIAGCLVVWLDRRLARIAPAPIAPMEAAPPGA
jgi:hypothetical protein